jgi:hypothetical protein
MISVILYGRNDAHGYNLHRRAALSLNCIAEVLTDPDDEVIFVDYNTPDELPTFIEAISDTLTERCLRLLRVLRVPAAVHEQRYAAGTRLSAIEPVARNTAVRRANPSNRWLLSTNTDMIFVPLGDRSMSEICRDLPDGFYGLPRFEIPEWLWERLPRSDPRRSLAEIERLGPGLRLDEPTVNHTWIRFDAPGDFQLILRDDFIAIDGCDEEMIHGWHIDSNLSRRLLLHRGSIESLEEHLAGYHCNHNRTRTVYHGSHRLDNDLQRFFFSVDEPKLPGQRTTWGLADAAVQEVPVRDRANVDCSATLIRALPTGPRVTSDARRGHFSVSYDSGHVMPFIADTLIVSSRDAAIGYLGVNTILRRMLAQVVDGLGFRPLSAARFDDPIAMERVGSPADILIIDLGLDASQWHTSGEAAIGDEPMQLPAALANALPTLYQLVQIERARWEEAKHPRPLVLVNSASVFWDAYVVVEFDCSHTTVHSRVRRATVKVDSDRTNVESEEAFASAQKRLHWWTRNQRGSLVVSPGESVEVARLTDYGGFGDGWAGPDAGGVWTVGRRAELRIRLDGASESEYEYRLTFAIGLVCVGSEAPVRVTLLVRDERIAARDFVQPNAGLWRVRFPSHPWPGEVLELTLIVDEPHSPRALGWSDDDRPLGIQITNLTLEEVDRTVRPGIIVSFCEGSGGERLLGDGWARPEAEGVWTVGRRAELRIRLDGASESEYEYRLTFAIGLVCVGSEAPARVTLLVGDERFAARDFVQPYEGGVWRVAFPSSPSLGEVVELVLIVDEPHSPRALGWSQDDRPLGIQITSLTLEEVDRTVRTGIIVSFCEGSGGERLLGDGWSALEPAGVWTVAERARLALRLADVANTDVNLVLDVVPFVNIPHPELGVEVWAGEALVADQVFRYGDAVQALRVRLPATAIDDDGRVVLDVHVRDPARPIDLGLSNDPRLLGLHLRSLSIQGPGIDEAPSSDVGIFERLRQQLTRSLRT